MHVLVSGAGIAGPAVAWHLLKSGAKVTILERNAEMLPHGQNIDISGTAVSVIKRMGLLDEVKRLNTTEKGTQLIDPEGRPFAAFMVREGVTASPTSEYEILRGDLALTLYNAVKDHPNIECLLGTTIKQVVSNGPESVEVELSDGSRREFDVLVLADGQWSRTRKACFPADSVKVVDKGLYTMYCTIPRLPRDNDMWNIYQALESRVLSLRPDPHGTIRAMLSRMPCNDAQKAAWQAASRGDRQTQEKLLQSEFRDGGWEFDRVLDAMVAAPDYYFHAIQQIRMSKWSVGRVVCLGDTAYAPTPLTGMGTSLAITGAYVLAGELSTLADGQHPKVALETFETRFRPFVEKTQNVPFFVPGIAHPETAWQRWLLHSLFSVVARVANVVVDMPWLLNLFSSGTKEDFPLPRYAYLQDE